MAAAPPAAAADSAVLKDVSESLKRLVGQRVPELRSPGAIVFESPGEIQPGDETKLAIYLYQVRYNPYLRNAPASLRRDAAGGFAEVRAPLAVDLLYIFVPYAKLGETQLVLVDRLERLFYDVPVLRGELLVGSLAATGNTRISVVPEEMPPATLHSIWTSFGSKNYRLSLFYLLTPVLLPSAVRDEVSLVVDVTADVHVEEAPS